MGIFLVSLLLCDIKLYVFGLCVTLGFAKTLINIVHHFLSLNQLIENTIDAVIRAVTCTRESIFHGNLFDLLVPTVAGS